MLGAVTHRAHDSCKLQAYRPFSDDMPFLFAEEIITCAFISITSNHYNLKGRDLLVLCSSRSRLVFSPRKRRYLIGLILLIGVGVLELLPPRLLGNAIDDIVRGSITTASLAKYIGMIFILLLVIYWITYIWMHKLFGGSNLVERLLRSRFMNHLMTMTPSFFEKIELVTSWPGQPMISEPSQLP